MGENKRDIYPFEVTKTDIQGLNSVYEGEIKVKIFSPHRYRD